MIVLFLSLTLALVHAFSFTRSKSSFVQPQHAPGVEVADFARHDLPPVAMGERCIDLVVLKVTQIINMLV